MGSSRVGRVSVVLLLLIVVLVCAAGGRGLAEEKIQKDHRNAAHKEGTTALGSHPRNLMVKTNDYGRYDPTPAFSRPRFKPIPH
ncbi:hypothetical protein CFC21_005375 [Triticum aestivum]|uniref:Uncharacterized protein n=3 Tax=Triticum TaxID=4564 RepID=A0A9R0QMQ6_TRITD|nr:uncharacterized protein LOC119301577 [Triticum dicoccoides]KAF6987763.1 hypothetical protein CFC21_005375 [Triticum aestivum]VAH13353.1 unnamed protein product [Triticum turgidum subsp. durum]